MKNIYLKMKKLVFISLIALLACTGTSKNEECSTDECLKAQAYDGVMVVHDEVMPKIGHINDLKGQLSEKMKSSMDSATASQYISLMQDLNAAEDAMWTWMRAFNADIKNAPLDSAITYLKVEQEKVDGVAKQINESIAAVEAALN